MFTFTPLYGAHSPSAASSSLIEFDGGVKILVDVGWDSSFDAAKLSELEKHVSTLSVVLLTHATVEHLGAYAHACKHVPGFRKIKAYATTPVANLGRGVVADMYASTPHAASTVPPDSIITSPAADGPKETPNLLLQPPTSEEITAYFAAINPLKYSQPHQPIPSPFSPSVSGLTITAYSAGHSLGGTIWHIQHGLESIVYAADWNLGRENFFPGAAWLSSANEINEPLSRPSTLICSSRGAVRKDVLTRRDRDERMLGLIRETIAQGGKVLIPTDSAARVLELAFLLNRVWRDNMDGPHADTYKSARIYMASKSGGANKRNLQSMLEWMDEAVIRDAEAARDADAGQSRGNKGQGRVENPLEWKHVKQIERKSQMQRALSRNKPGVFLASDASAEWGFSNEVLRDLATDPKNIVVLTEKLAEVQGGKASLARQLWEILEEQPGQTSTQSGAKVVNANSQSLELRDTTTSPLEPDEQSLYQQYLARQRQLHSALLGDNTVNDAGAAAAADDQASESSESSDEDEDTEHQGRTLNLSAQMTHKKRTEGLVSDAELGINVLLKSKNAVHDFDVRNKRGREKMFPFVAHRTRDDEFGEVIRPEEYLRAEERDDVDGVDMKQENTGVGQKRKWAEDGGVKGKKSQQNKRQKNEPPPAPERREPDDIDALIAKATGEALDGAQANGTGELESSGESDESDYEPEDAAPEGPQKAIFSTQALQLRCKIAHVDFCGLYRLTDLQGLIPRIRPRKLILTAGDEVETKVVADACRELSEREHGSVGEIFTPLSGEVIDASVDTHAWTLKLSRALMKRLAWKELEKGGGLSIASIAGRLGADVTAEDVKAEEDDESSKKKPKLDLSTQAATNTSNLADATDAPLPLLDILPQNLTHSTKPTAPIHVGDLRLHDIRSHLTSTGHTAEFRGQGALLIDGTVVVRKNLMTGGLEVEAGTAGWSAPGWRTEERTGTFWAVRRAIYGRLGSV